MKGNKLWYFSMVMGWVLLACLMGQAQQAPADMVFVNGKIITADDESFTSNLGTIAQAMHIQNGKILHIGTNDQIRPMAGANGKVIDLKGRTVIPGFILTHEHPWDWSPVTPALVKKILTDDIVVSRIMSGSPEENLKNFPAALNEAVSKAKPGQWIYFMFTLGDTYEFSGGGNGGYGRNALDPKVFNVLQRITKAMLDAGAPNNPVLLRDVFTATVANQKAIDEAVKVFPLYHMNPYVTPPQGMVRSASPAASPMRWMFQDVMLKDHYDKLVEVQRLGMEWWAGYGMTAYASNAYAPTNLRVYKELDAAGRMPIRNMWTWNWNPEYLYQDPFFLTDMGTRLNEGSDYLWFGGGVISTGSGCSTADPLPDSDLAKFRAAQAAAQGGPQGGPQGAACNYTPGSARGNLLYEYVKAGGRFINLHTVGDKDIDNMMDIIVKASKDAGMTDDQIRAKRHGFDHTVMWPRPDQAPKLQQYNFMASSDAFEIYQASPAVMDYFGEKVANWVVPNKRLVDAKVYNSFEMDRSLGSTKLTIFHGLSWMTSRKAWDGKVYATDQRVDRQTALKISSVWGSYYLLRENKIGSLKPGKLADFVVLDKDYLTVPEAEFENLRALMTVVGGKVIHLVPSLAREIGMQPAGAQVTLGAAPAQW